MEKIYIVIGVYHVLEDIEQILAVFKNANNACKYLMEKQNEVSVEAVELFVREEVLRDTY